jgi:transposase
VEVELGRKRRFRSRQERRLIVEETLKPGASVSAVARSHNINTNQVFLWRRQYREGWLNDPAGPHSGLVPVRVVPEPGESQTDGGQSSGKRNSKSLGTIEIAWGSIRVRIEGAADPESIRAVMNGLSR